MGGRCCRCLFCCCCRNRRDVPNPLPRIDPTEIPNDGFDPDEDEPTPSPVLPSPRRKSSTKSSTVVQLQRNRSGSKKDRYTKEPGEARKQEDNEPNSTMIVRAVFDYEDKEDNTLSFQVGDLMEVTLGPDGDWWFARKLDSAGDEGYIPSNFVQRENSLPSYDWFHGKVPRRNAEHRLLLELDNRPGTFLVRESENSKGSFALSVLVENTKREVKHYLIQHDDDPKGFYITKERRYETLEQLMNSYIADPRGLCCPLRTPCAKPRPAIYDLAKSTQDKWEIPKDELEFDKRIGQGYFGEVWKGRWKGQRDVAIKKLKEGSMPAAKFLEEAAVMKTLHHDRLVSLLAVCTKELYIVTELLQGSLQDRLRRGPPMHTSDIVEIARQIAEGMYYIEGRSYIHRDLATRNILIVQGLTIKIGDFGLARAIMENNEYTPEKAGGKLPLKWTAPEGINMNQFTIKSDVWSYGVLLVELTTQGAQPYPGVKTSELLAKLESGWRHPKPTSCPDELYEIMMRCWKARPAERPSFSQLTSDNERLLDTLPDDL